MSNYTDEQLEQIRAVVENRAGEAGPWWPNQFANDVITKLNPSSIHPDVPVMRTYANGNKDAYLAGKVDLQEPDVETTVLISEEIVTSKLEKVLDNLSVERTQYKTIMRGMLREIADYRRNGDSDE